MQVNFRYMRKLRRMLALRYYKIRTRLFAQFLSAMRQVKEAIKAQEAEIY